MIREERDVDFWYDVAAHPAVAGALMGLDPLQIAEVASRPAVLPLASDNGGWLIGRMDGLGLVGEVHAIYRPAGWGREALDAGKQAMDWAFRVFQVLVVHEMEHNPHSRPSLSAGFTLAGEWQYTVVGRIRMWVLTRAAWEISPMHRRMKCHLQ